MDRIATSGRVFLLLIRAISAERSEVDIVSIMQYFPLEIGSCLSGGRWRLEKSAAAVCMSVQSQKKQQIFSGNFTDRRTILQRDGRTVRIISAIFVHEKHRNRMNTIEMCAGAGGQALGLHNAGFQHSVLVEIDKHACQTLRQNNSTLELGWGEVFEGDLKKFCEEKADDYRGKIALVAGGVPCPPFSKAGKQLGKADERDLFPTALQIVKKVRPRAVMLENVAGLMEDRFSEYRAHIRDELARMGYRSDWQLLHASDFGVPQLRPRFILVALQEEIFEHFSWPQKVSTPPRTVGDALYDLLAARGWQGVDAWYANAGTIAPTLVGGSKKHGGPDLGPARAKLAWQKLGVNGHRVGNSDEVPGRGFKGVKMRDGSFREGFANMPLLNVRMAARIQGFPDHWEFAGTKTHAYRQVGNAFPPPVAQAVGAQIAEAIRTYDRLQLPEVDQENIDEALDLG
jgi:DNA (cytosine-5)-methyltransferase 1